MALGGPAAALGVSEASRCWSRLMLSCRMLHSFFSQASGFCSTVQAGAARGGQQHDAINRRLPQKAVQHHKPHTKGSPCRWRLCGQQAHLQALLEVVLARLHQQLLEGDRRHKLALLHPLGNNIGQLDCSRARGCRQSQCTVSRIEVPTQKVAAKLGAGSTWV